MGAQRIDADRIGHAVLEQEQVRHAVVRCFGGGILDGAGCIDRRLLGPLVFASQTAYSQFNDLVGPPLAAELWRQVEAADTHVVVVDAALIFEWGIEGRFDRIVAVIAPQRLCIARAVRRSGLPASEIERRLGFQLPAAEKARRADWVVDNGGDEAALAAAARRFWRHLVGGAA